MSKRVIVLPEELEIINNKLQAIEKLVKTKQQTVEDPILTTEEVMSLLKVSRRSVQNWRDEGLIAFSAVHGKFYYRFSDINKMLENHLQNKGV